MHTHTRDIFVFYEVILLTLGSLVCIGRSRYTNVNVYLRMWDHTQTCLQTLPSSVQSSMSPLPPRSNASDKTSITLSYFSSLMTVGYPWSTKQGYQRSANLDKRRYSKEWRKLAHEKNQITVHKRFGPFMQSWESENEDWGRGRWRGMAEARGFNKLYNQVFAVATQTIK